MMFDVHTHVLPGLDDGAKTWEQSLELVQGALDKGTRGIFATPHYMQGVYQVDPDQVLEKVRELTERLTASAIEVQVFPGMEVQLAPELPDLLKERQILTLNDGGRYLLVEPSLRGFPSWIPQVLFQLQLQGVKPILAHPERCADLQENPVLLADLVERGILLQLNSGSITGDFGPGARRLARQIVLAGAGNFLGSDAHSPHGRPADLARAASLVRDWAGDEMLARMTRVNPMKILNGEEIDQTGALPQPRKRRSWWRRGGRA